MSPLPFRTRLWLGHVVVLAMILGVAALGADWTLRRAVLGEVIDDAIASLASAEAAAFQADPKEPIRVHEIPPGAGRLSFVRLDKFVQIIDLDGHPVARGATLGRSRLPAPPSLLAGLRAGQTVFGTVTDFGDEPIRMVSLPVSVGKTGYAVQVAMSLDDAYAILRTGRWLFVGLAVVILAVVGSASALLARQALRPIDRIVAQARHTGLASLGARLPHPGTPDEIGRLVDTLNDMLERLERSFEVQRRFTADAAHELRSPLSRLRAELEVALRRPRDTREYEETVHSALDEVIRLQRLVEALLELARIDAGHQPEPPEDIEASDIVEAAVAAVAREAERRGVTVTVECPAALLVRAPPVATRIALANILDNAVKFSPPGGRVTVAVAAAPGEVAITVEDTGPGIAPGDLPQLFQRFYRGAASRSTGASGVGLGLAISRALLERQGGWISVESSRETGAAFGVHLPRSRAQGARARA
jgi:two-component system OmpR family sensor kinase